MQQGDTAATERQECHPAAGTGARPHIAARCPCCSIRHTLPGEREVGAAIRAGADAFYGPRSVAHPRYVQVRDLILTSMRGVGMTYAFDPRDPDTDPHLPLWKGLARTLLE